MRNAFLLTALAILLTGALTAETLRRELPAKPGGKLEVDLSTGGDITITGWDRDAVEVVAKDTEDEEDIDIDATANGVRISSDSDHGSDPSLEIKVPRRYDVEMETMGGDLKVSGVEGKIGGKTMGGDLDLSDLGGEVRLTTMGGDIRLKQSNVDGSLTTMGGEVIFEDVSGDVDGKSMGGNVIMRNVTRPDGSSTGNLVKISTMGGDIEVAEAPAGADVHTMGGDVEIGSAKEFVKAKTMGGDVKLGSVDGWIEATTMGGDVTARMVGDAGRGDRHVELTSMGGDITLTVPAGLSMNVDVELAFTKNSPQNFKITSDFPLKTETSPEWESRWGTPRKIIKGTGQIAGGKHTVKIRTINGNVVLKKG